MARNVDDLEIRSVPGYGGSRPSHDNPVRIAMWLKRRQAAAAAVRPTLPPGERTIVDDHRAFGVMVRNRVFDWVQRLARR